MPGSVGLPLPAVDVLFDEFRIGRVPQPFVVPSVGETLTERQRLREAIHRNLERMGVLRGGRLDADMEDLLLVLANGRLSISVAGDADGERLLARVATDGSDAVLARQEGNHLVFTRVRPTAAVLALLDLLPKVPAAHGGSMTVPLPGRAARTPAVEDDDEYNPFAAVRAKSDGSAQQRGLARVFSQPMLGLGVLRATTIQKAAGAPPREHSLADVSWWDFDQDLGRGPGRWYGAVAGEPRVLTVHPGDHQRMTHYLHSVVGPYLRGGSARIGRAKLRRECPGPVVSPRVRP